MSCSPTKSGAARNGQARAVEDAPSDAEGSTGGATTELDDVGVACETEDEATYDRWATRLSVEPDDLRALRSMAGRRASVEGGKERAAKLVFESERFRKVVDALRMLDPDGLKEIASLEKGRKGGSCGRLKEWLAVAAHEFVCAQKSAASTKRIDHF